MKYKNIEDAVVSKDDLITLFEDYVKDRMLYEKTGDEKAFMRYSTMVQVIYCLGIDYEFRQFCNENEQMKELKNETGNLK